MNRKPGFPSSTCSIKLPDGSSKFDDITGAPDNNYKKRQQLITFGHERWGFKNWTWSVTKQELDFVDFANGKYSAGVVAFVSVKVKPLDILREDVGYATAVSTQKGSAIHNARKASVTNALRETLLSFGGNVATLLTEQLELFKAEHPDEIPRISDSDNNLNAFERISKSSDVKVSYSGETSHQHVQSPRKDSNDNSESHVNRSDIRSPLRPQNRQKSPAESSHSSIVQQQPKTNTSVFNLPDPSFLSNNRSVQSNEGAVVAPQFIPGPPQMHTGNPHPPNVCPLTGNMADFQGTEEEMRAERKRRQKQKQEEFKLKQMQKNNLNLPLVSDSPSKVKEPIVIIATQDFEDVDEHSDKQTFPHFFPEMSKRSSCKYIAANKKVCKSEGQA